LNQINTEKLDNLNFKQIGINRIGKIENYFFDIEDKQDSENELVISINFAPNEKKSKLFEYFDELQKRSLISEYTLDKKNITVLFVENAELTIEDFLKDIVLKNKEIDGKCICQNCDSTEALSFYSDGKNYSLLCEKCGTDVINKFENDRKKKGNYLKGFIFSLAGALIGSAIWILIGAFGFFASIAGLAISYCAFKGYEIAQGKFTRKGIILNVIAIVIAFVFAQYAGLFLDFFKEYPTMKISDFLYITPIFLRDLEFMKALLPNIGLGILFIFLGTYRMIINNYKSAKNTENITIEKVDF